MLRFFLSFFFLICCFVFYSPEWLFQSILTKPVWYTLIIYENFLIFPPNILCGCLWEQWGSSNEYPQTMCLGQNMENNEYRDKSTFFYIKCCFPGYSLHGLVNVMRKSDQTIEDKHIYF